ncbi:transmembrane protein 18-like [Actinia tenebrosa]|uniref:Transmembrane protein 18 n=1 Tax=Actinia tenebrosa TaxID=6105 RepID=A0A6P8HPZ3_ACTTE|nr:transmembrane protein 18-like [Actinia tenebrosa]XP_031554741.1 transmembrane protein 18-like [Actinia tenebrosa]
MNSTFLSDHLKLIATDQIKSFFDFYKAINWREPWLSGLLIFHFLTFVTVILTRKHLNIQAFLFLCLLSVVLASEKLNALGEKHWRWFSKEQYFDSHGLFITAVLSGPIMINCFIMMVVWLWTAGKMLIVVGRGRIKEKRKQMAETAEDKKKEN